MHISLLPTSKPPAAGPEQALLETNLAWLRAELETAELAERTAALRHEIGILEELAGRDTRAVREFLAAVNALPRFKEPLERLIVLIERHRSFKNLPTLIDHLCRSADAPEEVCRAQLAWAWCALMHTRDDARAQAAAEAALAAFPNDAAALATLELLARRRGDGLRLRSVLEARVALGAGSSWALSASLELAEHASAAGEWERAHALLTQASADPGEIGLAALEQLVRLGRAAGRAEWTSTALDEQAARILTSSPSPSGMPLGSPRAPARAVRALLDLARVQAALGNDAAATDTLERASALEPDDPVVAYALLGSAEKAARHATLERVALAELVRLPDGPERSALGVRLAEARLARNEPLLALEALDVALLSDPSCWTARVLQIELLRGTRNTEGYARAREQLAMQLDHPDARRRYAFLAALDFVRHGGATPCARRAFGLAEAAGAGGLLSARVGRALAYAAGDPGWYAEATDQLLASTPETLERAGLLVESWRAAWRRGDRAETRRLDAALATLPEGSALARFLRASAGTASSGEGPEVAALLELSEQGADPTAQAALKWALSLRLLGRGERAAAREELGKIHAERPADCVIAGALSALAAPNEARAPALAKLLGATAESIDEAEFAASLSIEAGLRRWREEGGEPAALDFDAAERRCPGSAVALAYWARRASKAGLAPPGTAAREPAERLLAALESAASHIPPSVEQLDELTLALRAVGDEDTSPLASAARLLVLLLGRALGRRVDPALLDQLAGLHPEASRLVDAWRYLECIGQSDPPPRALEEVTRRWSESSASMVSVLEWLGATQRLGEADKECQARYRLSELLSGSAAELCAASAALVAQLSGTPAPFLIGSTPQLRLTNLETSPPGCDPRRRARALEESSAILGPDSEPTLALLRGYNLLAAGDAGAALDAFQRYAEAFPDDPAGFEALLAAARHGDDPVLLAETMAALGRTSRDPAHAARLFEEAAQVFFDELHDAAAGEAALSRAVELDIRRKSSFDRLLAWVRDSGDAARLIELCQRRLQLPLAAEERRDLEWERARAARRLNDTGGALAALDRVLAIDAFHAGALALLGEIYITTQRYGEAADVLARLASLENATPTERLTSGSYAVDLFENQLDATDRALQVLMMLHRAGLSTLGLRERQARAAAKSENWDEAVIVLEQLMLERSTPAERAEAARLALAIHRDRRGAPASAGRAAEALLSIFPHDAEALDLLLDSEIDAQVTDRLLKNGELALAQRLSQDPFQLDALKRLARVADRTGNLVMRQVALGTLLALGHGPSSGVRAELAALDQRLARTPESVWDEDLLFEIADHEDEGPIAELLALVAPHVGRAFGPDLRSFQVSRRERIAPDADLAVYREVAAWVGVFGLGDIDVYQSSIDSERIAALTTEPPSLVLGSQVTSPLGPFQRQELVRALYALRRQLGVLHLLEEADIAALVVALCSLAGVRVNAPPYPRQADFERQLGRVLPRKVRKLLPERARAVQESEVDVPRWVRAALSSLDRAAALVIGDISTVLGDAPWSERGGSATAVASERTRRLARFVLAPGFEALRQRAGVIPA